MPERARTVLIAMGSNLGDRVRSLVEARAALERALGVACAASRLYTTPPVYDTDQPPFLNAVLRVETTVTSRSLFSLLQQVEAVGGRTRTRVNGPRTLDLDLLANGEEIQIEEDLHVPHPRLHERAFVLVPLRDVAPAWRHPQGGAAIDEMLQGVLDDPAALHPLEHPTWIVS